jgi:hypothetical protein
VRLIALGAAVLVPCVCFGADRRAERPRAAAIRPLSTISSFAVVPAALQIRSDDPDASPAPVVTTVTWQAQKGAKDAIWKLTIRAGAGSFTNCGSVPISAVRVACSTISGGGGGGASTCNAPFALSGAPQQVAGGNDRPGNRRYAVTLLLSFSDKWKYTSSLGTACSLDLVYSLDYP